MASTLDVDLWISRSKEAIGRDKDKLHIALIREFLRCQRRAVRRRPA